MAERPAQINFGIWTKIMDNLKGSLDNIQGNTQQAELKRLEFHVIRDKGVFYSLIFDKLEWFYFTSKYLFKAMIRIQKKGAHWALYIVLSSVKFYN